MTQQQPEPDVGEAMFEELKKCSLEKLKQMANQRNKEGDTPLHAAFQRIDPHPKMVKFILLTLGAHPYLANHKGQYPMDLVSQHPHLTATDKTYYETLFKGAYAFYVAQHGLANEKLAEELLSKEDAIFVKCLSMSWGQLLSMEL